MKKSHLVLIAIILLLLPIQAKAQVYIPGDEFQPTDEENFFGSDDSIQGLEEQEFRQFYQNNDDVYLNEFELKLIDEREKKAIQEKKNREKEAEEVAVKKRVEQERLKRFYSEKFMISNVMYGIMTGGLLGAGVALTFADSSRTRVSSITTGVMLGAILGGIVGISHQQRINPGRLAHMVDDINNYEIAFDAKPKTNSEEKQTLASFSLNF